MTNSQSDRLDMFKAVIKFIEDTNMISSTRQGLIDGKTDLKDNIVKEIEKKAGKQSEQIGGTYITKNDLKDDLCDKLFICTSGIAAYAATNNNTTLEEQMNYSISELKKIGDETIVPTTNNLLPIIEAVPLIDRTNFGVDAAAVQDVKDARDAYIAVEDEPRQAQTEKSAQTEALPPLFTQGTKICREVLDRTAVTLKPTQGDWYNQYVNSRIVINTGGRTTTLDGTVMELGTTTGIYNVAVKAVREDGLTYNTKTDVNGIFKFSPIKRGTYVITFTHADFKDLVLAAFVIVQGRTVTKNVFMERK